MEPKINKVLVPVDFSDYSRNALRYSIGIAEHFNAELILIYVVEPIVYPPDFSMGQVAVPAMDLELDKRAREELDKLAKAEVPHDMKCKTIVKAGKPFYEIIETASEEDIDLIIIATHGHSGVQHILFGSTAEKVVRKAPCPVLTLREPSKGFQFKDQIEKEKKIVE